MVSNLKLKLETTTQTIVVLRHLSYLTVPLQDEAISVREAAVELLGRHMEASPEVAATYFRVVVQATLDVGVSVRKRAVRILWDCCIRCLAWSEPDGARG